MEHKHAQFVWYAWPSQGGITVFKTLHLQILAALSCAGLLGAAYYFEYALYLDPCPLCIMQRVGVLLVGLAFAIAAIHRPGRIGQIIYACAAMLAAVFGGAIAGRHVWIQSLPPDQVPTCGPSLEYMFDALPWQDLIAVLLRGNGNCAEQSWMFMDISMPQWVLIWFVGYFVLAGFLLWRAKVSR